MKLHAFLVLIASALLSLALLGCDDGQQYDAQPASDTRPLQLYTSVDEPIAREVAKAFTQSTGIEVRLVTDAEANKSVGIAERLRAESSNPRADVWWGNEAFHTVALASEGLFAPLPTVPTEIDAKFVDAERRWAGAGLRVRVVALHASLPGVGPSRLEDLLDPAYAGQIVMARPTAGTTGSQVAALYDLWGRERADAFFRGLHANGVVLVGGNSIVAQEVAAGRFKIGLTDNDDVAAVARSSPSIRMLLPDQGPDDLGTLAIPTTVALVRRDDADPRAARLVEFLLSPAVEAVLRDQDFTYASVRTSSDGAARGPASEGSVATRSDDPQPTTTHADAVTADAVPDPGDAMPQVRAMTIDAARVAASMPASVRRATALLEGREPE